MGRFSGETPLRSFSLSKPGSGQRERFFVPGEGDQDVERVKATDRLDRPTGTARYTWVLEHDTLVEQYVH